MATRTLTLDPVTRIEGHLRVDAKVEANQVTEAWCSAQMWRGIENILKGRAPEDAWTFAQRFCGVCTTVHGIGSIRAVENALKVQVPLNAQFIRNIMIAQHAVQDHLLHFYHLAALDWVDVPSALRADPKAAARVADGITSWPGNSEAEFKAVQTRLRTFVDSGKLGIFGSGYWGHPAMQLSPEINLMLLSHYLKAFDFQRTAAQAVAILGGKNPHIQNLVVGGVATALNLENLATINMERLAFLRSLMEQTREFVQQVYYPDVLALVGAYPEWFKHGAGVTNYMAVPEFPEDGLNSKFALEGGIITKGQVEQPKPVKDYADDFLIKNISESVAHAWYEGNKPLHPWDGETKPDYTDFVPDKKYTWCKAPRLGGQPVQVGPIAQILVCYAAGNKQVRKLVDDANAKLQVKLENYHSTMGRLLTRAMRAHIMADLSLEYLGKLISNMAAGDSTYANHTETPTGEFKGVGFHEAPRGTLSHWIVIRDKKIENYQAVVPTTWNSSPRDENNVPGPYEASLVGTPVADPEKPLEVLRTIHSFDPCIACAVHMIDPQGEEILKTTVK